MDCPPDCPPGLEYLQTLDQLSIKLMGEEQPETEGKTMKLKYSVENSKRERIYYLREEVHVWTFVCCGPMRPFDMLVYDKEEREVMRLRRPLRCDFLSW